MKAIVQYKYGPPDDVLQLREIDKPVIRDDEVLVRVRAASIHPDVWHVVSGRPYVLRLMGAGGRCVAAVLLCSNREGMATRGSSRIRPESASFLWAKTQPGAAVLHWWK